MINIHLNATFPRRTGGHAPGVHGRSVSNYRYPPSLWLATDETGGSEAQGVGSQGTVKMIKVSPKYPQRGIGHPGANGPIKNNQHFQGFYGGPGRSPTCDLRVRSALLYATELPGLGSSVSRHYLGPG